MSDSGIPIPPATFDFLVFSVRMQAESHLGLVQITEEKQEPNLPMAQHAIDMLAMLLDKTKGNLEMAEKRLLENSLTELRFRYVQVANEPKKAPE
jgi:Domain of unknown function (DUF1844)